MCNRSQDIIQPWVYWILVPLRGEHRPPPIWLIAGLGIAKPTRSSSRPKSVPSSSESFHMFRGHSFGRCNIRLHFGVDLEARHIIFWTFSIPRPIWKQIYKKSESRSWNTQLLVPMLVSFLRLSVFCLEFPTVFFCVGFWAGPGTDLRGFLIICCNLLELCFCLFNKPVVSWILQPF